jgi:hypothetical protein
MCNLQTLQAEHPQQQRDTENPRQLDEVQFRMYANAATPAGGVANIAVFRYLTTSEM